MNIKVCVRDDCQKEFETKDNRKRYCSRSCAATVNNSRYPKKVRSGPTHCHCGNPLENWQKAACSRECDQEFKRNSYISRWLSGEINGSQSSGALSSTVRKYLISQAKNKCTRCGWGEPNPVTGKPILSVDHIDGNWKNNSVDNLVVLCYNCHTLTPTFNALNIGNGQGVRGSGNRQYKQAPLV